MSSQMPDLSALKSRVSEMQSSHISSVRESLSDIDDKTAVKVVESLLDFSEGYTTIGDSTRATAFLNASLSIIQEAKLGKIDGYSDIKFVGASILKEINQIIDGVTSDRRKALDKELENVQ